MTEALQLPEPGDLIGGKYQVDRLLGIGGMGAVYEAMHRVTGKRFALKLLLPELTEREDVVKRFIREAQVAGRFQHPNVVEVYDIGEHGASFFMVMELLQGESLATRLEREQTLPVADACELVQECLDGVAAAHAAGIVHRDLKPANIFLCETRKGGFVPKVLDFGISKLAAAPGVPKSTTTDTGTVMGTPIYMAPEQLRSRGVDHRADIYALGVTLYQMLSGRPPFLADNYPDLVIKIWTETPPALESLAPHVPRTLSNVIAKAIARSANERYATAEEMARALAPFADSALLPGARAVEPMRGTASSAMAGALHVTRRVDDEALDLAPAIRARYATSTSAKELASGTRYAEPQLPAAEKDARRAAQQPARRVMETTFRSATPLASESIAARRIRERSVFVRSPMRWLVVAGVCALAAYGVWLGLTEPEREAGIPREASIGAATQQPFAAPPDSAPAERVAAPALVEAAADSAQRAPASAASEPEAESLVEDAPRTSFAPAPAPAPRASVPPANPHREPVPPGAAGSPRLKRALRAEPKVGEAAVLPAAAPEPVDAEQSAPAIEPLAADETPSPAPVRRPNPAIDPTQF